MAGVILAAGASRRMGSPKALLDAGGATFVARLANALRQGGCGRVWVVCAAPADATAVAAAEVGALVAVNPGGGGGQIGSLRVGIASAGGQSPSPGAIVFTPVDNPRVSPDTVRRLIDTWREQSTPIVVPTYKGKTGHPVLVDASVIPELQAEDLPEGARSVIRRDPGRVTTLPVPDPAVLDDVDTPTDYGRHFGPGAGAP